jgi:formylmethanofuran dehydrogenase subunit C
LLFKNTMIKLSSPTTLNASLLRTIRIGGNLEWGSCVVDGWLPMTVRVDVGGGMIYVGVQPANPALGMLYRDCDTGNLHVYTGENWTEITYI